VADGEARWCFFEGGGAVEAEGLTDGRPEESSLVSTWRSGGGGEGHQRGARRSEGGIEGQPERLGDTRPSAVGGRC
jgi:hypothetical protein